MPRGYFRRSGGDVPGQNAMAVNATIPILIVDDHDIMIRIVRNLLRQLGFEPIDEASDGTMALAKCIHAATAS
jgi:PleD family two-component response regulator